MSKKLSGGPTHELTICLGEQLYADLRSIALKRRMKMSAVIRDACASFVEMHYKSANLCLLRGNEGAEK